MIQKMLAGYQNFFMNFPEVFFTLKTQGKPQEEPQGKPQGELQGEPQGELQGEPQGEPWGTLMATLGVP